MTDVKKFHDELMCGSRVWGLDMVGPFKRSKDKKSHLLVAVDKFTKWVEAEPVSKCDAAMVVQFMKKVIFCFGFPTAS